MKSKSTELDVDFIGGQGRPLTKEEERAISEYIKAQKKIRSKKQTRRTGSSLRKRVIA